MTTVRALRMTGSQQFEIVYRDLPPVKRHQALVKIIECGLCSSDLDLLDGRSPDRFPDWAGHEPGGIVAEIGEDVTDLAVGDRVSVWLPASGGGLSEATVVETSWCRKVLDGTPYPAVGEPLADCVLSVEAANPRFGDDIVIIGAGFMSNLIELLSLLRGPRSVTIAARRDWQLGRALMIAPEHVDTVLHVVDIERENLPQRVREITGGEMADVVYEVTGSQAGLDLMNAVTGQFGTPVTVGYHQTDGGIRSVNAKLAAELATRPVNAHWGGNAAKITGAMGPGMRLVEGNILDAESLITHRFPFDYIEEAFQVMQERPDGYVKAVISM